MSPPPAFSLSFSSGTLELRAALDAAKPAVAKGEAPTSAVVDGEVAVAPPGAVWDARTQCHRAPAVAYADIVRWLVSTKTPYEDTARRYLELAGGARVHREPRPFQLEAVKAWRAHRGRGVVVLPTGAGKSHVALMAIDDKRRSTLVVAPTLDLVRQWVDLLATTFGTHVGLVGGGDHDVQPLTVTTYDSLYLHADHLGARFGLIVFDECHHLPSAGYSLAARACLAPYRLGLTATPERADGRETDLAELIGPVAYRKDIVELSGEYLAEYETERVSVELSPAERAEHDAERAIYRQFVASHGIRMSQPSGWSEFIMHASQSDSGRRAMSAYRRQRELAFAPSAKIEYLEYLLFLHRQDRAILFTQDNATAYAIARRFLVPALTHQTKVRERSAILKAFAEGTYRAISTSKVLNEGVDVPDANVAVILSGSGSVREHVQRLGRILRKKGDKRAVLYELVTESTTETYTSERRRDHSAYR
ncbi:MAG TPA: DEAD/DEAH box helicase family protein [Polyangiaceae bacterium]|nr:DEAD/DEAH box helicase family protein [Polyangiaceae bacterium]